MGLGASNYESELTFSANNRSGGFVSDSLKVTTGPIIENIKINRLHDIDSIMNLPAVDFIKIDVEGYEKNVLIGAEKFLNKYNPIACLEFNHWCLNAMQRVSAPDFIDFLKSKFPILLAVEGNTFLNLHDADQYYAVMYKHIIHFQYMNIVGAFSSDRLSNFYLKYKNIDSNTRTSSEIISSSNQKIIEIEQLIEKKNNELIEAEQLIEKRNNELFEAEQLVVKKNIELVNIYRSTSWLITKPLRTLKNIYNNK